MVCVTTLAWSHKFASKWPRFWSKTNWKRFQRSWREKQLSGYHRKFWSSLVPQFQSESKCETILMKMTLICMRMKLHAELIFIWKVSHLDSFWNRGTRELGNGLFSVFTSHVIKIKIVTIQWKTSRVWDTIDDWYINNLAKNQVSAVFHLRVICRSVSPKFIELCMETPCLCPSEGHKHGGRKVTETCVTKFCYWNAKLLL